MITHPLYIEFLSRRAITVREEWDSMVRAVSPDGSTVVEFGLACGGGAARWLCEGASFVIGIDVDKSMEYCWQLLSFAASEVEKRFEYIITDGSIDQAESGISKFIQDGEADILCIDGDHELTYDEVNRFGRFLKDDGFVVIHDVRLNYKVQQDVERLISEGWDQVGLFHVPFGLGYSVLRKPRS